MSAFPQWSTISTDEANRLLGLNSAEKHALQTAGEMWTLDNSVILTEAINDVALMIRGALANNLALRSSLENSDTYAIPQSLRSIAYPLIIRQLFIRYQINLSETREKACELAEAKLEKYAKGELLPESVDGTAPQDPAYMMPRYKSRPWFNKIRSTYR